MPARLTLADAQARVNTQGKKIRILTWIRPKEVATAECLVCGEYISCKGSTLLDKRRNQTPGCTTCGELAQAKARRRHTEETICDLLAERFPHITFDGITEDTLVKSDTKVQATCSFHGDLGKISLWQLIAPSKGHNPCRGNGCENRGGENALDWNEVKARLDSPGVLKPGISYHEETFNGANKPMKFTCAKHGTFWTTPKQVYAMDQGCRDCGKERVGEAKRIPTDEIRIRLEAAQGGRHKYPFLESEHGHSGTGTDTEITVVCKNGHTFPRTIESELLGAGCEYCPGTKSSQDETELAFELGQFDPSWDPFDTKVEGMTNRRLSSADIKLFNGQVIVESDPEYIHADRQKEDQKKSDALNSAVPKPKAIYRVREDNRDGTPMAEITGVTTIRAKNRSTVKERADAVLRELVQDGFLEMSAELETYLDSSKPKRSGEARAWYDKHKVGERRLSDE